jgi:hypothetical protein
MGKPSDSKRVYVICITSESGDDYALAFDAKPTKAQRKKAFRYIHEEVEGLDESGPGEFGTFLNARYEAYEVVQPGK